jgi:hypothetical protein
MKEGNTEKGLSRNQRYIQREGKCEHRITKSSLTDRERDRTNVSRQKNRIDLVSDHDEVYINYHHNNNEKDHIQTRGEKTESTQQEKRDA